jgi:hypothetical protein
MLCAVQNCSRFTSAIKNLLFSHSFREEKGRREIVEKSGSKKNFLPDSELYSEHFLTFFMSI